jgi:diaminohydroxyphosphoribosylaminopyrimidine deaminase/5-amino-6-(5-phosphoribosylamino)uracil reductase
MAGIARVVYALSDPNPEASGGTPFLRLMGVEVVGDTDPERARELNPEWLDSFISQLPPLHVTDKLASPADGRAAAADGSSKWITGKQARNHALLKRSHMDAILVGTGTYLADRPRLTARGLDGKPLRRQPMRGIVGLRPVEAPKKILRFRTRDLEVVIRDLAGRGAERILVEGGPTLVTAFLKAGLVNAVDLYLAPAFLGAGLASVGDLGIGSIRRALRFKTVAMQRVGQDVYVAMEV